MTTASDIVYSPITDAQKLARARRLIEEVNAVNGIVQDLSGMTAKEILDLAHRYATRLYHDALADHRTDDADAWCRVMQDFHTP